TRAALQRARPDPNAGGADPARRAAGTRRRARSRQGRLSGLHAGEHVLTVHLLEELSTTALDALDRARTVVVLIVSPLEEHGPHLPLGVDAFTARHFATEIAGRLVATRPGWSAVLAPTLHLGSFTFDAAGTVTTRQRVVRDAVVDYGLSLARAGFRFILIANGHAGPTHLAALEEAAAIVEHRAGVTMASLSGHLIWHFRTGRFLDKVDAELERPLTHALPP